MLYSIRISDIYKSNGRYFFPSKKLIKIFGSEGKANAALNALQDCILNEKGADGEASLALFPLTKLSITSGNNSVSPFADFDMLENAFLVMVTSVRIRDIS